MPELPEVESTRRAVATALEGKRIVSVDVARARMLRRQHHPADFATRMVGRTIRRFGRHGKFLMAELSGDLTWVTHLGMSGRVQLATSTETRSPHTNAIVRVGGRVEFRLVDPRTFGFVAVFTPAELAESTIGALGPDAYDHMPTTRELLATLAGRTAPVKALLLDQRLLSGVGNIYADESLHRARISPHREGGSLRGPEVVALRTSILATLEAGIEHGGTSLDDLAYLLPDGRTGAFVARLRVYGREQSRCGRCGGPIRRDVIRQRSSYWCPGCQR